MIKIDVEGFEHLVLKGARDLLATRRPALICECLPESRLDELERVLVESGYAAFRLDGLVRATIAPDPTDEPRNFLLLPA